MLGPGVVFIDRFTVRPTTMLGPGVVLVDRFHCMAYNYA